MKNLKTLVVLAGTVVWVASAGAEAANYNSKARIRGNPEGPFHALTATVGEISPDETSSKPWLHVSSIPEKQQVVRPGIEITSMTVDNYNTKKAVLEQATPKFELAPLK